jgi:L-aspartate oxidase
VLANIQTDHYDILIIGSGAAGLGLALSLAHQARIALLSKDDLLTSSSERAQGGIAAVLSKEDSHTAHIQDTLTAGAGLCDPAVVEFTVKQGKTAIDWLVKQGVQFSLSSDAFHLTQEGGHSHRRILHAADKTGSVVVNTLAMQVMAHPNIDCFTECIAIDLLLHETKCCGALVLDQKQQLFRRFLAKHTVLATGGASRVYQQSSNPNHACGDGIAMAWRCGANIANMEFIQFHPTCFYQHSAGHSAFLISEALRGEGGLLRLPNGYRFMPDYDRRAELAPRDIVARAIDAEIKKHHIPCVYVDISHQPADWIKQTFPTIYQECLKFGVDITRMPIPVKPAAHYTCGGIMTNMYGETHIPRLYAVGETAYTGLHGANRLASNSLLECLVFASSTAQRIQTQLNDADSVNLPSIDPHYTLVSSSALLEINSLVEELRMIMQTHVGIIRSNDSLNQAQLAIKKIKNKADALWKQKNINAELIELYNLATIAELVVESAIQRKESRGLHYNTDYPGLSSETNITVLRNKLQQEL